MKTKKIYLILLLGTLCFSCDNFLDVKPSDKVLEDDLYTSEGGFQEALNGIYLGMTTRDLFTENLSCGMLDIFGQSYYLASGNSSDLYYNLSRYDYNDTDVKSRINTVWSKLYESISGCNLFLQHLEKQKNLFTDAKYKLYRGEVLGLRGFLHLEVLRLFGPVYDGTEMDGIPYYDHFTTVLAPILSAEATADKIIQDLDAAMELLKNDPVRVDGIVRGDGFWDYRNYRMNYYAVCAVKARACLHFGRKAGAFEIASSLLPLDGSGKLSNSSVDPVTHEANNFHLAFTFVDRNLVENGADLVYYSEQLFCMHNLKRETLHKALFSEDLEATKILRASPDKISNLYDILDIRKNAWKLGNASFEAFKKFAPAESNTSYPYRHQTQSLLRLSELMLIAAESTDNSEVRRQYLDLLRVNRGFQIDNTGADLNALLRNEYEREFCGEGQFFYYLKRHNVASITPQTGGSAITLTGKYQLPMPDSEKINRN